MPIKRLSQSGLLTFAKHSSVLAGNAPFSPSSFDLLETTTLSTSASSVTFSGLGAYSDYKHLQIRNVTRTTNTANNSTVYMSLTFNGATSGYSFHKVEGDGGSASAYGTGTRSRIDISDSTAEGSTSFANVFGASIIDILDFSSSSKNTTVRYLAGANMNSKNVNLGSGSYPVTTPVTTLTLTSGSLDFAVGSRFSLYGSK